MKRDALDSTKMKRLARRLDLPRYAAIGLMESLWKLAERDAPQGDIGKLSNEDIAVALDWRGNENDLISALVQCGWLDETDFARLWVHDWNHHCEDSVHARLARAHELFANGLKPNTGKLKEKERAAAELAYAAAATRKAAAAGSRREPSASECGKADASGGQPLPSPSPSPTKPIAPPVAAAAEEHPVTGSMVAQSVMFECSLSGRDLRLVLDEVCRIEIEHGAVPGELRDRMVDSWRLYSSPETVPRLEYRQGAQKFFGENTWRDSATWPWKAGFNATGKTINTARQQGVIDQAQRVLERRRSRGMGGYSVGNDSFSPATS